jgi:hypothetical protein
MLRQFVFGSVACAGLFASSLVFAAEPGAQTQVAFNDQQQERADVGLSVRSPDAAQEQVGPTLFAAHPHHRVHFGGYAAPSFGVTSLNDHTAFDIGARGAFIMNDRFGVGLAGYAMGWDGPSGDNPQLNKQHALAGGYGGLLLEYRVLPWFPIHGLIDTTFGGGFVCTSSHRVESDYDDHSRRECDEGRGFGMILPTASVEVNLTRFMRLSTGAGYRFAFARDRDGISGRDLSGWTARTNLQFGWF